MFCTKCGALLIDNKCPKCDYTIEQNVITENVDIDNNSNVQVKNIVEPIDNASIKKSQPSESTINDMENSVETIRSAQMLPNEFTQNSQLIENYDILADNSNQLLQTSVRDRKQGRKLFIIQIITALLLLVCAIYMIISNANSLNIQSWASNNNMSGIIRYELNTEDYRWYELNDKTLPRVKGEVKYIIAESSLDAGSNLNNQSESKCIVFLLFKNSNKNTQDSFYYITTTRGQLHKAVQQLNERYGAGQIPTITPSSEEVYHD